MFNIYGFRSHSLISFEHLTNNPKPDKENLPYGPVKILVKAGQVLNKPEIIQIGENQDVTR